MRSLVAVFPWLALTALAAPAGAQTKSTKPPERTIEPRKWEHETSDLKPDEKYNFGSLKNGVRYVWANNNNPPKQVFLRLHVNVGSLVEQDNEQGIAHFIEHMAFNGTKNFKAGTLIETFQKEGIKFGHDVNAQTSMEQTFYELDLPDIEIGRLKKSLLWFKDIASGLLFEEKEVHDEKGVVDAEQRDRDSEGFRNYVTRLRNITDGTLVAKRLPIGIKDVRAKFTPKICFGFYRKWYRPENVTCIIVGDLGDLDPKPLIEESLGTIPAAKDPLPDRPAMGKPTFATKGFALETEGDAGLITIARLRPGVDAPDNVASRTRHVALTVMHRMTSARLDQRKEQDKLPWLGADASDFEAQGVVSGPTLRIPCKKGQWHEALMAGERELRRINEKGFTEEELNEARADFDRTLVPRPKFPPPDSREYVAHLLRACNDHYVPMEDRASKESYKPGERALTLDGINKLFKEEWGQGELVLFTEGGIDLGADPAAELMEVWNAAKATSLDQPLPVKTDAVADAGKKPDQPDGKTDPENDGTTPKKPDETKKADAKAFAYAMPDVIKDANVDPLRMDDIKVTQLTFKNGVKAIYKKSMADERGIGRFEVRVGEGALAIEPTKAELAWVAGESFLRGGLTKNDWETVEAAGGNSFDFSVEGDACVFSGISFGGELKRPFEIICAYLTDPGWRQDGFDAWKKDLPKHFEHKSDEKEGLGTLIDKFQKQIFSGERRLLDPEQLQSVDAYTLDDVKNFMKSQLDGPVAITIVGVDALKVEKAIYSTFGKLPPRRAAANYEARRVIAPLKTGLKEKHDVDTGGVSALIHMIYPLTDGIDAATNRKLELLEDVVQNRLLKEIREKRGGAYSPRADVTASTEWKGLGWVTLDVQVDPAKVDEMTKACALTMETLGAKGVTQSELDAIRTAKVGDTDAMLKNLDLWFGKLQEAHARPAIYEEMRNYKTLYDKVTLADMNALCKQFFVKGKESVFIAMPKK